MAIPWLFLGGGAKLRKNHPYDSGQSFEPFSAVNLSRPLVVFRSEFALTGIGLYDRNRSREVCEISGLYLLHRLQAKYTTRRTFMPCPAVVVSLKGRNF